MGKLRFDIILYLAELRSAGHRNVPTHADLAAVIDITPTSFSRLSQNQIGAPNRLQLEKIINYFRDRGFKTTPGDLLRYYDDPT